MSGARTRAARKQSVAAYSFAAPYSLLLVVFGLAPAGYALFISFVDTSGRFAGIANFLTSFRDFRYAAAFAHIAWYGVVFIVPSMVISIGLALLLQGRSGRVGSVFRFIYYLPQALAGAAGVILWLFMLTPRVSPFGGLMRSVGWENIYHVLSPGNLAAVLAMIAIWTSANGVLMMYAALSSIPPAVIEAARLDGATTGQIAWFVKLPMLRKWIAYTVILNVAASTQLVVEPEMISAATGASAGTNWSPLQLAYTFAYTYSNFPVAAALSVQLMVIAGVLATVVIKKTQMFRVEI